MKRYIYTILRGIGYGIGFALISFMFKSCDVNAQSIHAELPEWGNYVFGFGGGPHVGWSNIDSTDFNSIEIYSSKVITPPTSATNVYFNVFLGNYDNSTYDLDFYVFYAINKEHLTNFTANGSTCILNSFSNSLYNISCKDVSPTNENGKARVEIRGQYLVQNGTTRIGISEYFNITKSSVSSNNEVISNENKNHEEAQETRKGILGTLKSVFDSIVSLPGKIVDLLVNALKSLFIPDDMDFLTNFVDSIGNKLGFIGNVPIQVISFGIELVTYNWNELTSITFPSIEFFGVHFWNDMTIDITEGLSWISSFKYITDVIVVILMINSLRKEYERFTGGD